MVDTYDIEEIISELNDAKSWSGDIVSNERLGYLIKELRSGDPKRVSTAMNIAMEIIYHYRARRSAEYEP